MSNCIHTVNSNHGEYHQSPFKKCSICELLNEEKLYKLNRHILNYLGMHANIMHVFIYLFAYKAVKCGQTTGGHPRGFVGTHVNATCELKDLELSTCHLITQDGR